MRGKTCDQHPEAVGVDGVDGLAQPLPPVPEEVTHYYSVRAGGELDHCGAGLRLNHQGWDPGQLHQRGPHLGLVKMVLEDRSLSHTSSRGVGTLGLEE